MDKESPWYSDHSNICALARYLKDEGHWHGVGGVGNLIYFFEKPWKYCYEWEEYQQNLKEGVLEVKDAEETRLKKRSG